MHLKNIVCGSLRKQTIYRVIILNVILWPIALTTACHSAIVKHAAEAVPADGGSGRDIFTELNDAILTDFWGEMADEKLLKAIEENVILGDDEEIEACEWVSGQESDYEWEYKREWGRIDREKRCLRIWVRYKEPPPDNYQHKEDYFFFVEGEDIQVLHVDYPTKDFENIEKDRYVWDACGFPAYFEDVTFDGQDDLILSLGHAGSRGDSVHAVYVYEEGFYCYKPGFEEIPNYEVDVEEQVIRGWANDSAVSSATYIYKYQNGDFELISCENYDTDIPGYNSSDTLP